MIRISALNEASNDGEDSEPSQDFATNEAQEEEAFRLYNKALSFQRLEDNESAEKTFKDLLQTKLISQASSLEHDENEGLVHPGQILKYSALKNLGIISLQQEKYEDAMEYYLEAVILDSSDVTLWHKIGMVALNLNHYPLARNAFEQGLKCNNDHWLCLDKVITVLYALNDYNSCLYYIAQALEKDCSYIKGLAIRDAIFKEHVTLKEKSADLFRYCDRAINTESFNKEEGQKFIEEGLEMREMKKELSKPPPKPALSFKKSLKSLRWKCLGECLINLYEFITSAEESISFICHIDLSPYLNMTFEEEDIEIIPVTVPSSVSTTNVIPASQIDSEVPTIPYASDVLVEWYCLSGDIVIENEDTNLGAGKKGCKRKRIPPEPDLSCKRRSARVRNTKGKKQENINYQELLKKFLPSSLILPEKSDSETDVNPLEDDQKSCENMSNVVGKVSSVKVISEKGFITTTETEDVHEFIKKHQKNCGMIHLMYHYVHELSNKAYLKWPINLPDVVVNLYNKLRKHLREPPLLCRDQDDDEIKEMALMFLISSELKMDKWQTISKTKTSISPSGSPRNTSITTVNLGPDFPGKYFEEDLDFMVRLTIWQDILGDDWLTFAIRVFWLKSKYVMLIGRTDLAVYCLDKVAVYLSNVLEEDGMEIIIKLPNCIVDNVITLELVKKQLESLQRCQSLEEVHRLYEQGDYQNVVDLLLQTFHSHLPQTKGDVSNESNIPERHAQLLLLQDSLWQLENYELSLYWGEMSFTEALQQVINPIGNSNSRHDWIITMTQLLNGLDRILATDINIIKTLPSSHLIRFTQNLIKLIAMSMDVTEGATEMPITTLVPWILLYRLIEHEESVIKALAMKTKSENSTVTAGETKVENVVFDVGMPSSLMLLYTAHEYLGRHSWCCNSDGALLLFYVDVLLKELKKSTPNCPHPYKEDLENSIEQCFYCLYGHPNKKTKARHLQEHSAPQITLSWEKAIVLFEYFKPTSVPEFDSYKTNTVSGELENLLRRISLIVPDQEDPPNTFESVTTYIEGQINRPPYIPEDKPVILPVVKELYYLLADYYFKNKEQGKAIKFYILDICYNPERFDSWAGMALARSSRLEQKMNSCDLKNDGPIYKQSSAALRCFKRALELDNTNSSLWIEYGSLAYQIHSHASRQLKQHIQFGLNTEMIQMLRTKRQEMLQTAKQCFLAANRCEGDAGEERWLHHYMLGKIAEKMGSQPQIYLDHYSKAAYHLHEDKAHYPRKIHCHNPPDLAMEALEVYYRTHTSMLKYLQSHLNGVDYDLLEKYIRDAAEGPFANFREKESEKEREDILHSVDIQVASVPTTSLSTSAVNKKKKSSLYTVTPTDHDYLRHLSKESSSKSDAESSVDVAEVWTKRIPGSELSDSQDKQVKLVLQSILMEVSEKIKKESCDDVSSVPLKSEDAIPSSSASVEQISELPMDDVDIKLESVVNQNNPVSNGEIKVGKTTDVVNEKNKPNKLDFVSEQSTSLAVSNNVENTNNESKLVTNVAVDNLTIVQSSLEENPDIIIEIIEPPISSIEVTTESRNQECPDVLIAEVNVKENPQDLRSTISSQEPNGESAYLGEIEDPTAFKDIGIIKWAMAEDYEDTKKKSPRSQASSTDQSLGGQISPRFPGVDKKRIVFELEEMVVIRNEDSDNEKGSDSILSHEVEITTQPIESSKAFNLKKPHSDDSSSDSSMDSSLLSSEGSDLDSSSDSSYSSKKSESNKELPKPSVKPASIFDKKTPENISKLSLSKNKCKENEVEMIDLTLDSSNEEPPKLSSIFQKNSNKIDVRTGGYVSEKNFISSSYKPLCVNEKKLYKKIEKSERSAVRSLEGTSILKKEIDKRESLTTCKVPDAIKRKEENSSKSVAKDNVNELLSKRRKTEDEIDVSSRHIELMKRCIQALDTCLQRFPQHYKSLYRLAFCYFNFAKLKNEQWARDLMLGTTLPWQNYSHMPSQGLFHERKQANFFNGIWRIPIEEIDRPGSFASHMYRSIVILFDILNATNDNITLYQVAVQLQRNPDQGNDLKSSWFSYYQLRKYLRDMDRTYLAKQAFHLCILALHNQMDHVKQEREFEKRQKVLLEVYKVWQHALKLNTAVNQVNELLIDLYKICRKNKNDAGNASIDVVIRYCQMQEKKISQIHGDSIRYTTFNTGYSSLINPIQLIGSEGMVATTSSGLEMSTRPRRSSYLDGGGTSEVACSNMMSEGKIPETLVLKYNE